MEWCGSYKVRGYICEDELSDLIYCCNICESNFKDVDTFRYHNCQKLGTELADLDVNCLDNIFKFLTPNDLAALSLTCSKYKKLTERFFDLHCRTSPIKLNAKGIQFQVSSLYEKYFHSLVRHVEVGPSLIPDNAVFQFIRDRCNKRLLSLELTGSAEEDLIELIEINGSIIEDQLKNLQNLRLNMIPYPNIYKNLLRYCHHLRSLLIDTAFLDLPWDNAWTNEIYLELETLQLYVDDGNADLTTFFQRNPNVKTVCCLGNAPITSICRMESQLQLQRAMMIFDNFRSFNVVKNIIDVFCRRNNRRINFQKLEMAFPECEFSVEEIRAVIELPNITAFHCTDKAILQLIDQKYTMTKMEKLCIYDRYQSLKSFAHEIEEHFPNLCELRLFMFEKDFQLTPMFKQFRQMKQIYLGAYHQNKLQYSMNDFIQWNSTRSQVANASKVTIYLPVNSFEGFNVQKIEKEFVEVKPLMEEYCECLAACEFDHRHGIYFSDVDNHAWSQSSQES